MSVGIIELTVEVLAHEGNTPALDIYNLVRANGVECSPEYIQNLVSTTKSIILELQRQGLLKRTLLLDTPDGT